MDAIMASNNEEVSRLLVLSPDVDSKLVIDQLRELCGDVASKSDEVSVLHLQTKYYKAVVEVHAHQVQDNAPVTALAHELHEYEALLCVVDAARRDSFVRVQRLAKNIVDTLPYDVCLLAAATAAATTESVCKMKSWSQANGFEFVDLDADKQEDGEDDVIDEKHGIERVLEALHCNMWRAMEMNPTATESKAAAASPELDGIATVDGKESKSQEEEKESKNQVEDKETDAQEASAVDDSRLQTLLQALKGAGGADSDSDGDDDNFDMSEFGALLSEVRNVRDEGQTLTDEQRRERAAEVALKLWSFLGDDAEGSDSASN